MFTDKKWRKGLYTLFLISAFLLNGLPVRGQDIVTSSDLLGGSSAFVFRSTQKPKQTKVAFRSTASRSVAQKRATRTKIVRQATTIAKSIQKTRPTKRIDEQEYKRLEPQIARMTRKETSLIFAGAGEYYLERDEVEKAIGFFRESVKLDADNKFARLGLSDAATRKGNELLENEEFDAARVYFEEAVKYDEQNALAYAGLAEIFDSANDLDKAISNYEKALSLNSNLTGLYTPLGIAYYQKGEIAKAKDYLTKALATDADNPETQFFLGSILYKETDYKRALTAVERALKSDPENSEVYYLLANIQDKLERNDKALDAYKRAVDLNPKMASAWFDLGAAHFNDGNFAEAAKAYETVIRLDNRNWQAYLNLADTYWQAGEYAKAEGSYNLALNFIQNRTDVSNEEKAEIYNRFGWTLGQQCRQKMEAKVQCNKWTAMLDKFEKATALVPDAVNYSNLGWAYFTQGHLDLVSRREAEGREKLLKAKAALENAVKLNPPFIEAPLMNLGGTLIDLGEYPAAIETLKRVAGKRGDWEVADYMLGVAYRKNGDLDNAAKAFSNALKKNKDYVAALAGLGETQYRRNKKKEADQVVARLMQIGTPDARREAEKLQAVMKLPL